MWAHPEAFAHIQQDRKHRTLDEAVSVAECLARKHGNLPCRHWLRHNGFSWLRDAMWAHPEAFAHIQQDRRKYRTSDEWLSVAEGLARIHGKLPCRHWLRHNGFIGLVTAMRRRPDLFVHIDQESKKDRTPADWVPDAERLVKAYGKLPNHGWLKRNGYNGLYYAMRKHPRLFAHIV